MSAEAEEQYDLAVIGSGLGGISAALRAAEAGRSVALIEAGANIGGTALFSGGGVHIWGARSWNEYRRHCLLADPVLAKTLFDHFYRYVDWLVSTEAPGRFGSTALRGLALEKYQIGNGIGSPGKCAWFAFMRKRIERLGGTILCDANATALIRQGGAVTGVAVDQAGQRRTIAAAAVILATGGFQANPELLKRYIGGAADNFIRRSVEHDIGDGLRMAVDAGAAVSANPDTLYGHLMPAPPCAVDWTNPLDPLLLSAFYAQHGLVINSRGERFVDEGDGELTGATINAACRQPEGGLWVVLDDAIRRDYARYEVPVALMRQAGLRDLKLARYLRLGKRLSVVIDSLRQAQDRGAPVYRAATLDDLAAQLAAHGIPREVLLRTIAEFNIAAESGQTGTLAVPKTKSAFPIARGPFWAVKVAIGVSMTYGGIAINEHAEALDEHGNSIPGLYAVPGAAGGVHYLHYAGALAACGVYGMIAADRAVAALPTNFTD